MQPPWLNPADVAEELLQQMLDENLRRSEFHQCCGSENTLIVHCRGLILASAPSTAFGFLWFSFELVLKDMYQILLPLQRMVCLYSPVLAA